MLDLVSRLSDDLFLLWSPQARCNHDLARFLGQRCFSVDFKHVFSRPVERIWLAVPIHEREDHLTPFYGSEGLISRLKLDELTGKYIKLLLGPHSMIVHQLEDVHDIVL